MRLLSILALLFVGARSLRADELPVSRAIEEDALLTVPELIEKYGYPVEVHHVESQTGYILEMHRIPYGRAEKAGPAPNKPMVFVQHGLLSSSADWIIAGPKKGLGYLLADLGYDVWMGNARGNTYSRAHKKLSPDGSKFWDFSWHEIGVYDLPAMIDYALMASGQKQTFYIGHSQGTTAFFVMCSELPEYNSKIRAQFSLAPIVYMHHLFSPLLKFIASHIDLVELLLNLLGVNEFLPKTEFLAWIGGKMCSKDSLTQYICTNSLFVLCGFSVEQMNTELLPVIMGHTPAGSSTKQFLHYGQLIKNIFNKFRQYDYGLVLNAQKYKGSLAPPDYALNKVTAPVALIYGSNDWLAAKRDVKKLFDELPNKIGMYPVLDDNFNHLDFLWGKNVDKLAYNIVFSLMTKF